MYQSRVYMLLIVIKTLSVVIYIINLSCKMVGSMYCYLCICIHSLMTYEGLVNVRCTLNVQIYIYFNISSIAIYIIKIKNISDFTGDIKGQLKVSINLYTPAVTSNIYML